MTKVDIFSGFLGAGKTTLIRKLIEEAYGDEKIVLIENEFGEIGVDKGFLKNTGIQINQMNAGCICCTLVGDFGKALNEVIEQYHPDRILIEPSGVGKLSDVIIAVQDLENKEIQLNGFTTVVDAKKAKMYLKNFGEFYVNQVEHASSIILSHVQGLSQEKIDQVIGLSPFAEDMALRLQEGESLKGILDSIFGRMKMDYTQELCPRYSCDCSRERMERALISLGRQELQSIIEEDGKAELVCHFCNKKYAFDKEALTELLKEASSENG